MTAAETRRRDSDPRAAAIHSLVRWERGGRYINLELDSMLEKSKLSPKDRALYAALVYGVCERIITLDGEITRLCGRDTEKIDTETLTALRLGIYQLNYMDKIPSHAAVNETVGCAPERSRTLVNAALRRFIREGGKIKPPDINKVGAGEYLSAVHSVPLWIVNLWQKDYPDDVAELCAAANRRPPATLRVNDLKITPGELLIKIKENYPGAEINSVCPDMIDLPAGAVITELYGYDDGLWFVQDAASRICAAACGAAAGETVIDVCAAPGGKSFSLALDMKNRGRVISFDIHKNKLGLIRDGAARLGLDIIEAGERDGRTPDEKLFGTADCVLCDAPCSGLGVLAKKPDIRYKKEDDIKRLPEIQYALLSASAAYVREGGRLVYSTCTLRRAENDDIREKFLSEHKEFSPYPVRAYEISAEDGAVTLMPYKKLSEEPTSRADTEQNTGNTDGFYITEFIRNGK